MNEQLHTGRITQKQQKGTALCPNLLQLGYVLALDLFLPTNLPGQAAISPIIGRTSRVIRRPLILGQYNEVFWGNNGTVVDQC